MENEIRKENEVKVEARIRNPNHPQKEITPVLTRLGDWKMSRLSNLPKFLQNQGHLKQIDFEWKMD